jgi:predicted GNAT family acetyltransferase
MDPVVIEKDEAESRFVAHVEGQTALLVYRRSGDELVLVHTEVPQALQGHGIAGELARAALESARADHLSVVPLCPFVQAYIRKHPEYQPLVRSTGAGAKP